MASSIGLRPRQPGRVAEVVESIRTYIEDNELHSGEKLPPERVFVERLGVSRASLREAIRVLATMGLVVVRHGDGMYVSDGEGRRSGSPVVRLDVADENALRNLVESRLGIELAAATAATSRATAADLRRLEDLLDAHEHGLPEEWNPLSFELAVVEITGNSMLQEFELMLRDAWMSLSGGLRASVGRHGEWLAEHRAILASMRSGNTSQVQRLVIAHLSLERFEEQLSSAGRGPGRESSSTREEQR